MARVVKPAGEAPAAGGQGEENALAIMDPNLTFTVGGREVTVREYSFFEGLEVAHKARAFIADMHAQSCGGELRYDQVRRLFGAHRAVVVAIAAQSADVATEWVEALNKGDAEVFMSAWFAVNCPFFVQEVMLSAREDLLREGVQSGGGASSTPLSPQAMGGLINSGSTPSGN